MKLSKRFVLLLCLSPALLLSACSNDDDDGASTPNDTDTIPATSVQPSPAASPSPEPTPTSAPNVDASGIYEGQLTLDSDIEVAIVQAVIAQNGDTTMSIYADDSDLVTAIAVGVSTQSGTELEFSGLIHSNGEESNDATFSGSVAAQTPAVQVTAQLAAGAFGGALLLESNTGLQANGASLSKTSGDFLFTDSAGENWSVTVADNGTISATATKSGADCQFSGSLDAISAEINVYTIDLDDGVCAPFTNPLSGTAFIDSIETADDILHISAAAEGELMKMDWFRQ